MNAEIITLIAALTAALTSVVTLVLNARLTILREQRMLLWKKELDRIFELEQLAGVAKEIAIIHHDPDRLKKYYLPIYDELDEAAGRFSRYPSLTQAIHGLNHSCATVIDAKTNNHDFKQEELKIKEYYKKTLLECDKITGRQYNFYKN